MMLAVMTPPGEGGVGRWGVSRCLGLVEILRLRIISASDIGALLWCPNYRQGEERGGEKKQKNKKIERCRKSFYVLTM